MNLTKLANGSGSDKGSDGDYPHRYTYLYDLIFHSMRDKAINFLEIGLCRGGPELGGDVDRTTDSPSVKMWLEYFSQAKIFGFDISDFSHLENSRFRFVRGDSGKPEDLRRLAAAAPSFDVIIDDASHASYHQQLALKELWGSVSPGGFYIIEDLHWQSPYFENDLPRVPKTGTFLRDWFERDVYTKNSLFSYAEMEALSEQVWSSSIFPTFTEGYGEGPRLIVLVRR